MAEHTQFKQTDHNPWILLYDFFSPDSEKQRESLCTLGNGYFATRGAAPEADADETHYPGTYLAGGYNRQTTHVDDLVLVNEDLVNLPNWLCLKFRINRGDWFDLQAVEILDFQQALNIHEGILYRYIQFEDAQGRQTTVRERRLVHLTLYHLGALQTEIIAENWSGDLEVCSALNGRVLNTGVRSYQHNKSQHLEPIDARVLEPDNILLLETRTNQSHLRLAQAAVTRFRLNGKPTSPSMTFIQEAGYVAQTCTIRMKPGDRLRVEKTASLYSSRDQAILEPAHEAIESILWAPDSDSLFDSQRVAWQQLWERFDIELKCKTQEKHFRPSLVLHLHIFHLIQTATPNSQDLDVGIPARGWTGEAYQGHVFWDDLFIFPFLNLRMPEITRSLLKYRHRRLNTARRRAKAFGYEGALYPWQSASNGEETTPTWHFNPKSGQWVKDHSHMQRHVNAAIAYNIWQYYQVTGDLEFLAAYGAEMLFEIARFWASIAEFNPDRQRYEIHGVMGPDEYHDRFPPNAEKPGLNNNTYTNIMAAWSLCRALELLELLHEDSKQHLLTLLHLTPEEFRQWETISRNLFLEVSEDGIIAQFEGYFSLQEFPWQELKTKRLDHYRLSLVLQGKGGDINQYKVSKQADVLMLFYLFSSEELQELFERLGYEFHREMIPQNVNYYLARDARDSTLSRVANAWVLARSDRAQSWELFTEALESDVCDIQGGTTPEGVHLGAMAGTVDIMQRCYTGIVTRGGVLWLNPRLPDALEHMRFRLHYRKQSLEVVLSHSTIEVTARTSGAEYIHIGIEGKIYTLQAGENLKISKNRGKTNHVPPSSTLYKSNVRTK